MFTDIERIVSPHSRRTSFNLGMNCMGKNCGCKWLFSRVSFSFSCLQVMSSHGMGMNWSCRACSFSVFSLLCFMWDLVTGQDITITKTFSSQGIKSLRGNREQGTRTGFSFGRVQDSCVKENQASKFKTGV